MSTVKKTKTKPKKYVDDIDWDDNSVDADILDITDTTDTTDITDITDITETETETEKRRPGRPRKNVPRKKLDRVGIVNNPENSDESELNQHSIELLYENPIMFKKIFTLFKAYSVENIYMTFESDRVFMYSVSQDAETKIMVEIFCDRINKYYVDRQEHPLTITLNTEYFYNICQSVSKDFSNIIFVTTRQAQHSKIWMIFVDDENEESQYEIDLSPSKINPLSTIRNVLIHEPEYQISFELAFKYLKRKIAEYGNLKARKINIEQTIDENGSREIYFACETLDRKISNKSPLRNTAKANFISTYDGPLFTAPIFITSIRPLANTLIAEKIKLSIDEKLDLVCTANLDYDIDPKTKSKIIGTEKCKIRVAIGLARAEATT